MHDEAVAASDVFVGSAAGSATADRVEESFIGLYHDTFPKVYAFFRTQVGSSSAQGLTSRVYLKAYQHRRSSPPAAQAPLWVFRIAHNVLIDYRRVEGRREAAAVVLDEFALPSAILDPEAAYAAKQRHALLLTAVGRLNASDRVLIGLRFFGQRDNGDIAAILKTSSAAVSMRLLRALRRLRRHLAALGPI
jgi:RNA polymerase sigma-70 factor (ECF subfamily)